MRVEERLLLDRIALHAADVPIGNVQHAAAIEADLADAGRAVGNRAGVAAGMAAQPAAVDGLDQLRRRLDRPGFEHLGQRGHKVILRRRDFLRYGVASEAQELKRFNPNLTRS